MIVCDVVNNSIWYDPRVIKQLCEYSKYFELYAVGLWDYKFNEAEISRLPGHISIVPISKKYYRKNRTFITKIIREFLIFKRLKNAIKKTGADIIHANDLNALVPAYYAAKKMRCKLIYDTHEVFLENHNIANSKLKKCFWSYFERKIIKKIDYLVCVSNAAAEYFKTKYKIDKVIVVTNCAKKNDTNYMPKTITSNYIEVLNHGQFYAGRGYDLMIETAKLIKDKNIKFVLRGFGSIEKKLREEVEKSELDNVIFEPPCKVYELINYASRSHIGLAITQPTCLNFELSVSNKLFEYASAGLPVIMSNIPEHRYLNEKYSIGIILNDNTPTSLYSAIEFLVNNKEFYKKCSENAIKMSSILNWEAEFLKLMDLEKELVRKLC